MKYSIIIPTMLRRPDLLIPMLRKYGDSDLVGEILLIDNVGFKPSFINGYKKVVVLNDGNNLFVNPSWNLGVKSAVFDNIILANDDICIEDIDSVLIEIQKWLQPGRIIGVDRSCFKQKRIGELNSLCIYKAVGKREYGFGVFMALCRESYIPIPAMLKVWFGDSFLYDHMSPYVITGVDVKAQMRTTSKTLMLTGQHRIEKQYYNNYG